MPFSITFSSIACFGCKLPLVLMDAVCPSYYTLKGPGLYGASRKPCGLTGKPLTTGKLEGELKKVTPSGNEAPLKEFIKWRLTGTCCTVRKL